MFCFYLFISVLFAGHNMYRIALTFTTVNVGSLKRTLKAGASITEGLRGEEKLATVTSQKCWLEVKGGKP